MTNAEPGWDLYRSFLAVLRLGSLSAAGRALGLSQPAVGRHIAKLQGEPGRTRAIHPIAERLDADGRGA